MSDGDDLADLEDLSILIELYCKNNGVSVRDPMDFGLVDPGTGVVTIKKWTVQGVSAPTKKDLEEVRKDSGSVKKLKNKKKTTRVILPVVKSVNEIDNPELGMLVLEDPQNDVGLGLKVYRNGEWQLI